MEPEFDAAAGYELPIFLEDQTGLTTGTVFLDLYNRQKISYLCLSDDSETMSTSYGIFSRESIKSGPEIILEFGANNSLGTIRLGKSDAIAMDDYLPRVSSSASSRSRHFVASNGERYQWTHCQEIDQEWACSNSNGEVVSYYSLKLYGEPEYKSSGCMLTVERVCARLSCEMLASCMIMRHIAEYDL